MRLRAPAATSCASLPVPSTTRARCTDASQVAACAQHSIARKQAIPHAEAPSPSCHRLADSRKSQRAPCARTRPYHSSPIEDREDFHQVRPACAVPEKSLGPPRSGLCMRDVSGAPASEGCAGRQAEIPGA